MKERRKNCFLYKHMKRIALLSTQFLSGFIMLSFDNSCCHKHNISSKGQAKVHGIIILTRDSVPTENLFQCLSTRRCYDKTVCVFVCGCL